MRGPSSSSSIQVLDNNNMNEVNISCQESHLESNNQQPLHKSTVAPSSKKIKLSSYTFFCGNNNVEEFLNSSLIGRGILHKYSTTSKFDTSTRADLVRLLIDAVLSRHDIFTSKMAESLAEEIIKVFPSECKGAYYYPAITQKKNSGGKLLNRYRNIRRRYTFKRPRESQSSKDVVASTSSSSASVVKTVFFGSFKRKKRKFCQKKQGS